jgi:membrane protein DedA with SNARE-associated domain
MWIESLLPSVISYMPIIILLSTFLWGEAAVIILSIFASQTGYNPFLLYLFSFIGTVAADSGWFLLGRAKFLTRLKERKMIHKSYVRARNLIDRLFSGNHVTLLITIKFFCGLRFVTLMYLGRKMKFKEFFFYNFITSAIWIALVVTVGWFAGKGVYWVLRTYKSFQIAALLVLCIGLIFYILRIYSRRAISKKINK